MQLPGQVVTDDGERIGVVRSVAASRVALPDVVTRDVATGEEVDRREQGAVDAAVLAVEWEDGTDSVFTEHVDEWTVLGSVETFPKIDDDANPPPGAYGELPEQGSRLAAVDVTRFADDVRAVGPLAEAVRVAVEPARQVVTEIDGAATIVSE